LENYSIDEQANIFSNAGLILAPHGAGLTNLIFSNNKNVNVFEFFSKSYVNACYASICALKGFEYTYHISNIEEDNGDYFLEPSIIDQCLEKYLKKS
jgi:capsular polysaccharide biosynthesis protein